MIVHSTGAFEQMLYAAVSTTEIETDGSTLTLKLTGSLEGAAIEATQGRIEQLLLAHPRAEKLVLDMANVDFLDSRGIGLLLNVRRSIYQRGGEVFLKNPQPKVRELLALLKIDTVLHTISDAEVDH